MVKIIASPDTKRHKIMLPKVNKTGNEARDKQAAAERNLLTNMIAACLDDGTHIVPLYDMLLQRSREAPVVAGDGDFQTLATVYAKCYEEFLTSWIVSVSDFTVDDLMTSRKSFSSQVVFTLARLGLQIPASFRSQDNCREKAFVLWLFNERHKEIGEPLKNAKSKMRFNTATGVKDYKSVGRYTPEYEEGKLVKLRYNGLPALEIVIDPNISLISQALLIQDVHSDIDAVFIRDPLPPEKLMNFYKQQTGPWAAKLFRSGKAKEWREWLDSRRDTYDALHAISLDNDTVVEAAEKIGKQKADRRRTQIAIARVAMQNKMKEEVGKRRYRVT